MKQHDLAARRDALKKMVAAASVMAIGTPMTACATSGMAAAAKGPSPRRSGKWDMSWVDRIQKPRRIAIDTREVQNGASLAWLQSYLTGAEEAYGSVEDDATVLILAHAAVPIGLGDDMWARLNWGETQKLKDPSTGETTKRNPFINVRRGDRYAMVSEGYSLDALIAKGTVVLACNRAFGGIVATLASREKISRDEAREAALAALVPGVILMPNGVFAVGAAQNAGCGVLAVR